MKTEQDDEARCLTRYLTYLNNRYYDPTLGAFVSVDPLVGKTGTPYLYANGNPATLADPSGLSYGCGSNGCIDDQNTVKEQQWVVYQNHGPDLNSLIRELKEEGAAQAVIDSVKKNQRYSFDMEYDDLMKARAIQMACYGCPVPFEMPELPPLTNLAGLFQDVLAGFGDGADGGGIGVCSGAGAAFGTAVSVQTCTVADTDGVSQITSGSIGIGPSAGASADIGGLISNSDALGLRGWSVCGTATGVATGMLCGSITLRQETGSWEYTGAWMMYTGMSTPTEAGVVVGFSYSRVDELVNWPTPEEVGLTVVGALL